MRISLAMGTIAKSKNVPRQKLNISSAGDSESKQKQFVRPKSTIQRFTSQVNSKHGSSSADLDAYCSRSLSTLTLKDHPNDGRNHNFDSGRDRSKTTWANRRRFSTGTNGIKSLEDVAECLRDGCAHNIVICGGAGMSTASGIPDFRTPGTGLYDNLQRYDIPYPEAIFDIDYFDENPRPFFALAKELYPSGRYQPNYAHYFARLLHDKGMLLRMYTQNIDGLERLAGLPAQKLVEAHGTFATATCTDCEVKYAGYEIKSAIFADRLPKCKARGCGGIIKPDIVFFGEDLPKKFYYYVKDMIKTDLVIVMGTSLEVQPFAGIVDMVRYGVPRVLFNRELIGPFRRPRSKDITALGDLVTNLRKFVAQIGWTNEMVDLISSNKLKNFEGEECKPDAQEMDAPHRKAPLVNNYTHNCKDGNSGSSKPTNRRGLHTTPLNRNNSATHRFVDRKCSAPDKFSDIGRKNAQLGRKNVELGQRYLNLERKDVKSGRKEVKVVRSDRKCGSYGAKLDKNGIKLGQNSENVGHNGANVGRTYNDAKLGQDAEAGAPVIVDVKDIQEVKIESNGVAVHEKIVRLTGLMSECRAAVKLNYTKVKSGQIEELASNRQLIVTLRDNCVLPSLTSKSNGIEIQQNNSGGDFNHDINGGDNQ